jgi:hypothetical protein
MFNFILDDGILWLDSTIFQIYALPLLVEIF